MPGRYAAESSYYAPETPAEPAPPYAQPYAPYAQGYPHVAAQPARLPFSRRVRPWMVLVSGYLSFGRSFAYLGVPPLFIGELFIGVSVLRNRDNWLARFVDDVLSLRPLPVMVVMVMAWGVFEVFRGIMLNRPVTDCLRTFAFNYYPICVIIAIDIGRKLELSRFIGFWKVFSLFYTVYSLVYVVYGANADVGLPWKGDVTIFGVLSIAPIVPVGILALWPYLETWRWRYVSLTFTILPMFASPGRGAFLGLAAGLAIVCMNSARRLFLVAGVVAVLGGILVVVGPLIPGQSGRAQNLDPIVNVARVRATFDPEGAYRMLMRKGYQAEADNMIVANGTAQWRQAIWTNAMHSLNTTALMYMGQGHGTSLVDFTPDGVDITTPHNFVIYAIFYTGGVGLALFCLLLLTIVLNAQELGNQELRTLILATILQMVLLAAVGNMFETPTAAIPFYLLSGICIGLGGRTEETLA